MIIATIPLLRFPSLLVLKKKKEKNIYNRLKSYTEDNDLLYVAKYGFREKSFTQLGILDMANNILLHSSLIYAQWIIRYGRDIDSRPSCFSLAWGGGSLEDPD